MDANLWTDEDGRLRDKRGRFARYDSNASTTDPNLAQQLEQQARELKAIRSELAKLTKSSTDTNKRVRRGFESVEEKLCWDALLQDAILATCICLTVGSMAAYRWVVTEGAVQAHNWVLKFTPNLFDKPVSKLLDQVLPTDAQAATTDRAIALPIEQQAFLNTIAQMEGADYNTLYGGGTFTDFSHHPKQCIPIDVPGYAGKCSDAAGRYQFISTTWDGLGMPDFSPESQDEGAIALIQRDAPEALSQLKRGDIDGAFCSVGKLWASLPCNSYGQNPKSADTVRAAYEVNLAELRTAKLIGVEVELGTGGAVTLSSLDTEEPKVNEAIGAFVVTSVWGNRNVKGGSQFHMGLDLAAADGNTVGKPVYAIGAPGESIEVRCWKEPLGGQTVSFSTPSLGYGFDYLHLDSCIAGEERTTIVKAGDKIGTVGNSGAATTGAHLHIQQRKEGTSNPKTGTHEPVSRSFAEMAVGAR